MMKHFLCVIGLLCNMAILGGFSADTLVKTNDDYVPIEYLEVGDAVVCCDMQNHYVEKEIVAKKRFTANDCVCVLLDGASIVASRYQYFYIADKQIWKKAEELVPGDVLLGKSYRQTPVKEVVLVDQEIDLYDISVKDCHNFLVLENDILVHNFAPVIAVGISWAVGAFTAEAITTSLSVAVPVLGYYIGCKIKGRLQGDQHANDFMELPKARVDNARISECAHMDTTQESSTHVSRTRRFNAPSTAVRVSLGADKQESAVVTIGNVEVAGDYVCFSKNKEKKKPKSASKSKDKKNKKSGGSQKPPKDEKPKCSYHGEACLRKHPHGKYKDAPYHHKNSCGGRRGKSPAPIDGQSALDCSVPVDKTGQSSVRVGVSRGQIVELKQTLEGEWHGYVVDWNSAKEAVQKVLIEAGWFTRQGKLL